MCVSTYAHSSDGIVVMDPSAEGVPKLIVAVKSDPTGDGGDRNGSESTPPQLLHTIAPAVANAQLAEFSKTLTPVGGSGTPGGITLSTQSNASAAGSSANQSFFTAQTLAYAGSTPTSLALSSVSSSPDVCVVDGTPTSKRDIRLLKNREAAKECRRKKKEYVRCLENRVAVLEAQNSKLMEELKNLKDMYCHKVEETSGTVQPEAVAVAVPAGVNVALLSGIPPSNQQ
eukprot:scpid100362/ scgid1554/ cAMP-responsive element modulator